ncbi:MAG: glycosyltransferase [Pseudomonadota bacterium]
MAEILLVTNGPIGIRFSVVELARKLTLAGHQTTLVGTASLEELTKPYDLAFRKLPESRKPQLSPDLTLLSKFRNWLNRDQRRRRSWDAHSPDAWSALLDKENPDLLLIDGEMHEQILLAGAADTPLVTLNTFASIWRTPGAPPPHTSIRPGIGWSGTWVGTWLAWRFYFLRKRYRAFQRWLRWQGCDRLAVLRVVARELAFDLDAVTDRNQWLTPFTWSAYPALSLHARELEFFPETVEKIDRPSIVFTGPLILKNRRESPLSISDRKRLDELYRRRAAASGKGYALLMVALGSHFSAHMPWLLRLFSSIENRPEWELIVTLGGQQSLDAVVPADRVHVFSWLPQLEVLAHVDAAVVHGGVNTIDECLYFGVPMLVCSGGETDMSGNQARVLHHGLGLAAQPDKDTALAIEHKLLRLLMESGFRNRAQAFASTLRGYEKERVAEKAIESLLQEQFQHAP